MAIQHRRGVYNNFDPTKLLPGEWAVVLSGDSGASDGMTVYICFAAGVVKRMATYEDIVDFIIDANPEVVERLSASMSQLEDAIETAEELRVAAENDRVSAENARVSAEAARDSAENGVNGIGGRVKAESERVAAENARAIRFAEIEQIAQGWTIHHCTSSEYNPTTRKPTVSNPDISVLYCVPNSDATSDDGWMEWRYDSESQDFEPVGTTQASIEAISTSDIDSITADTPVTGEQVLKVTGLSYLWTKLKAVFAAIAHNHSASEITSGTLPIERGGTGASTAAGAKTAIVDGQALSPASVTAKGTVKAATIQDSGGTLAQLRESVSPLYIASGYRVDFSDTATGLLRLGFKSPTSGHCNIMFAETGLLVNYKGPNDSSWHTKTLITW